MPMFAFIVFLMQYDINVLVGVVHKYNTIESLDIEMLILFYFIICIYLYFLLQSFPRHSDLHLQGCALQLIEAQAK